MSRTNIKKPTRLPCIGDMKTLIAIADRVITEPNFEDVDFGEVFPEALQMFALVQTVNGRTRFNGVDTDLVITHEVTIRFDSHVTSESWILLNDVTFLKVEDVEDINNDHRFMILQCTARGERRASLG